MLFLQVPINPATELTDRVHTCVNTSTHARSHTSTRSHAGSQQVCLIICQGILILPPDCKVSGLGQDCSSLRDLRGMFKKGIGGKGHLWCWRTDFHYELHTIHHCLIGNSLAVLQSMGFNIKGCFFSGNFHTPGVVLSKLTDFLFFLLSEGHI